ncbi:MAG TPA: alginate export family protein [Spirochaetota bacterium]|nr:alginate export family protein [Spirochaetota bacterium]
MKKFNIILPVIIALFSVNLYAQSQTYDSFFYSPRVDEDMKVVDAGNSFSRKGIQYGLDINPSMIYQEADDYRLFSYLINARLWAKTYLWSDSFLYVRVKDSYLGVISAADAYSSVESDNLFDLDLAYLDARSSAGAVKFAMGRKYFTMGTGLVLDGRGDGAELSYNGSIFSMDLLGMYTGLLLKDNNPYGFSDRDTADGAKRVFAGGKASIYYENQEFYLLGLAEIDLSDQDDTQKTKYDAQYYGAGLNGVFLEGFAYYAEFVYEMGKGYATGNKETDIKAFAINSGLDWYLPVALNPVLMLQYAFATGDENRSNYTTSNMQGSDTEDSGFMYFGTFNGGYALKPVLGNMHVISAGASCAPFAGSSSARLKKMSLMAKYSYYMKDVTTAGVNEGDGGLDEAFLGQGVDASLRWEIYYDLSFYINYGVFFPGSAYDSGTGETQFAMAGINLSY